VPDAMSKSSATLSLDLDNLWSYLRAYGDPNWAEYPSFLDVAVPRILRLFDVLKLRVTIFIVGRDAESMPERDLLQSFVKSEHEIGNHSFDHALDFHRYSSAQLENDFARSEAAISTLGAASPRGFRGPSFRLSREILEMLSARAYQYDASTFPTCIGPLARAWQRVFFNLSDEEKAVQSGMFGNFSDARRPLGPYEWQCSERTLIEIPVSTMPLFRLPIHWTYVNFLASFSRPLALAYVRSNVALSSATRMQPSLLLHATDFIGRDDQKCPRFLPGMKLRAAEKIDLLQETLTLYTRAYQFTGIGEFIDTQLCNASLGVRRPIFKSLD
jgi:peptidoglycan-N-acetylglucosamine deacetylase